MVKQAARTCKIERRQLTILVPAVFILLLAACTAQIEPGTTGRISPCHIIYDAGSSRTRLHIYESTATGWVDHRGPGTAPIADPIRKIRGKTMADAGAVVDAIVATLDEVRSDGPISRKGEPEWSGFDWKERCHIETVAVYATAGMRLAQQQNAGASAVLWEMLNDRLSSALGMEVTARTLTGYEEAVFAWLAVREGLDEGDFGVAEMGGASVQIAFPCAECETARQVRVKGHIVPLYADSFLGWGQDEAWEKLGPLPACERGVGLQNPNWQIADCATGAGMVLADAIEFRRYVDNAQDLRWYLSGAFRYMRDTDIDHFCRKGLDSGFQPDTSCFRAIYLQNVLNALRVPMKSAHSTADWPLGAVICTATQCL